MARSSLRARRLAIYFALWLALGLLVSTHALLRDLLAPDAAQSTWPFVAVWNAQYFLVCGLLALVVEAVRRRWPLVGGPRRHLYLHIVAAFVFALLHTGLTAGLIALENPWFPGGSQFSIDFARGFLVFLHHELLFYWLIVGAGEAFAYDRRLRSERAVRAALERELGEARLAALRMQLHPHFLFNALNAVAELLRQDAAAAVRMLAALERLLDAAVASAQHPLDTLREEFHLLDRYLDIERVRFGRELTIACDVEAGCDDALVPTLLLQPLVENALRHGRRPGAAAAAVRIAVRRRADRLRLELVNELPSQAATAARASGVGLANCGERLLRLYGDRGTLRASASADGARFQVDVELPFETLTAAQGAAAWAPARPGEAHEEAAR